MFLIEIIFCKEIGIAEPNDNNEARNNVPHNPPPNDLVPPQKYPPNNPLPPQNPPRIEDLIIENLA